MQVQLIFQSGMTSADTGRPRRSSYLPCPLSRSRAAGPRLPRYLTTVPRYLGMQGPACRTANVKHYTEVALICLPIYRRILTCRRQPCFCGRGAR